MERLTNLYSFRFRFCLLYRRLSKWPQSPLNSMGIFGDHGEFLQQTSLRCLQPRPMRRGGDIRRVVELDVVGRIIQSQTLPS